MFVAIEGFDAAGKSTIAALCAKRLGWKFIPKRPESTEIQLLVAKKEGASEEGLFQIILRGLRTQSSEALRYISINQVVACDRWIASEFNLHKFYCQFKGDLPVNISHHESKILKPDLVIFLDAPVPVRRKRMEARGNISRQDAFSLTPEGLKFKDICNEVYGDKILHIDTSVFSVEETMEIITQSFLKLVAVF